jgi:hypothetical protein
MFNMRPTIIIDKKIYEQQLAQQSSSGHTNSSKCSNNQEVARIYQLKDKKQHSGDD